MADQALEVSDPILNPHSFSSNSFQTFPKVQPFNCSNMDQFVNKYELVETLYNCARTFYTDVLIANEVLT